MPISFATPSLTLRITGAVLLVTCLYVGQSRAEEALGLGTQPPPE